MYDQEEKKLEILRSILVKEERKDVENLRNKIENPEELKKLVEPIVQEQLDHIKRNFPDIFGDYIRHIVDQKIEESQDKIINTVYPALGVLTKKYIQFNINLLREQVDEKFSGYKAIKSKIQSILFGVRESDIVLLKEQKNPESAFLIEKNAGIILGEYHQTDLEMTNDSDLFAGMLTAIKSFASDSFQSNLTENKLRESDLSRISYSMYDIYIQDLSTTYVAVIMKGYLSAKELNELQDKIYLFSSDKRIIEFIKNNPGVKQDQLSDALKTTFFK